MSPSHSNTCSTEYSKVLGETLTKIAETDKRIVAVTAAMTPSLGLSEFFKKFPDRAVDVGICEEHATILCASMATEGLKPYYAVYSTFLQRSFDEIIIDICSQNLPVTICVDRAGISGADGETHQGVFDLSFLTPIPNLTIAVPKDVNEFKDMIMLSAQFDAPLVIRYPRDGKIIFETNNPLVVGKWEYLLKRKGKVVIIACGERSLTRSLNVAEKAEKSGVQCSVINARFVKPLDTQLLNSLEEKTIVTVEDNMLIGGLGSLINDFYAGSGKIIKNFAYSDEFIPQGGVDDLMNEHGLNDKDIYEFIINEN
jgi:1-deoxy-D-xylulose-5-phosphate synthase